MAILRPGRTSARQRFSPAGFGQHHFDAARRLLALPAQRAPRKKARGNHAAVVEHQQIARLEQCRKLREAAVAECPGGAIQHHHAALAALGRRLLRNQFLGQVVIEIGDAENRSLRSLSEMRQRPQARAFNRGIQLLAFDSNCCDGRSAGTSV